MHDLWTMHMGYLDRGSSVKVKHLFIQEMSNIVWFEFVQLLISDLAAVWGERGGRDDFRPQLISFGRGRTYLMSHVARTNLRGRKLSRPPHGRQIWNQRSHKFKLWYITQLSYKRMFRFYRASAIDLVHTSNKKTVRSKNSNWKCWQIFNTANVCIMIISTRFVELKWLCNQCTCALSHPVAYWRASQRPRISIQTSTRIRIRRVEVFRTQRVFTPTLPLPHPPPHTCTHPTNVARQEYTTNSCTVKWKHVHVWVEGSKYSGRVRWKFSKVCITVIYIRKRSSRQIFENSHRCGTRGSKYVDVSWTREVEILKSQFIVQNGYNDVRRNARTQSEKAGAIEK